MTPPVEPQPGPDFATAREMLGSVIWFLTGRLQYSADPHPNDPDAIASLRDVTAILAVAEAALLRAAETEKQLLAALYVFGIEPPENDGEEWSCCTEDGPTEAGDTAVAAATETAQAWEKALARAERDTARLREELEAIKSAYEATKNWGYGGVLGPAPATHWGCATCGGTHSVEHHMCPKLGIPDRVAGASPLTTEGKQE